eukprot:38544-Pelagomonas_calceolata.AAC.4
MYSLSGGAPNLHLWKGVSSHGHSWQGIYELIAASIVKGFLKLSDVKPKIRGGVGKRKAAVGVPEIVLTVVCRGYLQPDVTVLDVALWEPPLASPASTVIS